MRKYIVRKNFDENNSDELNAPNRTVFFEKKKIDGTKILQTDNFKKEESESTFSTYSKQNTKTQENKEILSTEAKKIFDESVSAIQEYDKKRLDNIYR